MEGTRSNGLRSGAGVDRTVPRNLGVDEIGSRSQCQGVELLRVGRQLSIFVDDPTEDPERSLRLVFPGAGPAPRVPLEGLEIRRI